MTRTKMARAALLLAGAACWAAVAVDTVWAQVQVRNPHGVAVIIGNRSYRHGVPEVDFAHRDAAAFKHYVVDVLGFDQANIIELHDAGQSDMEAAFGNERSHEGTLWSYLDADGNSDVVVFYSGHGVPDLNETPEGTRRAYLLPTDAHPNAANINGYPIDLLFHNLGRLEEARTIAVYLDACFSGNSDGGPVLTDASPAAMPASLPAGAGVQMTVLTAAAADQLASWDREAQHGLFTHHLLEALYGKGDADDDGRVTAAEAKAYLDRHMTRAARRLFRRPQEASLIGLPGLVLRGALEGEAPRRPELPAAVPAPGPTGGPAPAPAKRDDVDRAVWEQVKDSVQLVDQESYLQQCPTGAFVELARTRLAKLLAQAQVAELSTYLTRYPEGSVAAEARTRLAVLQDPTRRWSAFKEAPMLAQMVEAGTLPPVDQRLPLNPWVVQPLEQVGRYGGTVRVFAVDARPSNDLTDYGAATLATLGPDGAIVGHLAHAVDESADRRAFRLRLRPGTKWSDGHPFTSRDINFMFEDLVGHPELDIWNRYPQITRIEVIDELTIRLHSDSPLPGLRKELTTVNGGDWYWYQPLHHLRKWHLRYNRNANELAREEGFATWAAALVARLPWQPYSQRHQAKPTLHAWELSQVVGFTRLWERNPYYWKVDTDSQQLPYIDRIVSRSVDSLIYRQNILRGEADIAFARTSAEDLAAYRGKAREAGYRVVVLPPLDAPADTPPVPLIAKRNLGNVPTRILQWNHVASLNAQADQLFLRRDPYSGGS